MSREGKADIYLVYDSDCWVIELEGFGSSPAEIRKEFVRLIEFLAVYAGANKCKECFLGFPTQRDRKDWIESLLRNIKRTSGYAVHVYSKRFEDTHKVIKVFIDKDNKLSGREGVQVGNDSIVVGIELSSENPFVREQIREFLRKNFQSLYLDPTKGQSKYWLQPQVDQDHYYDIVFLPEGRCPEVDMALVSSYQEKITRFLESEVTV